MNCIITNSITDFDQELFDEVCNMTEEERESEFESEECEKCRKSYHESFFSYIEYNGEELFVCHNCADELEK